MPFPGSQVVGQTAVLHELKHQTHGRTLGAHTIELNELTMRQSPVKTHTHIDKLSCFGSFLPGQHDLNFPYIMTLASSWNSSLDMNSSLIIFTATFLSRQLPSSTSPNWPLPISWPKVSSSGSTSHWSVGQHRWKWHNYRGRSYQYNGKSANLDGNII